METLELAIRLLAAVAAGAAIGLERQIRDKAAGLRTHILVAVGAATYLIMSAQVAIENERPNMPPLDPLRVVGGLIGGIGFLAAGVIIERRGNVRGLTTAASLWLTAALGAAAGLGQFVLVGLAVVITLLVLWPIQLFEHRVIDDSAKIDPAKNNSGKSNSSKCDSANSAGNESANSHSTNS